MPVSPNVATVANRLNSMSFQTLADFAQTMHDALVANAVTFPAPPLAVGTFQTNITAFQTAINAWGAPGARGAHANHIAVLAARQQTIDDCTSEGAYVQAVARATAPGNVNDQKSIILLGGCRVKNDSNQLQPWGQVNDFRQLVKQNMLGTGNIVLRWAKPNVVPGAMSKPPAYNVFISDDGITWTFEASTSSTTFTKNVGQGVLKHFQVAPVSAQGQGATSAGLQCYGQ